MKFLANTLGQVMIRVSGPQASGKSVFVREVCEYLQAQDISYHYEEIDGGWLGFDPNNDPPLRGGRNNYPAKHTGGHFGPCTYTLSRKNAKYVFVVG